jgi:hypothetical protein
MNSNELREHIRKLNEEERHQTELRRQQALAKIRRLREERKYNNKETAKCQKEYF